MEEAVFMNFPTKKYYLKFIILSLATVALITLAIISVPVMNITIEKSLPLRESGISFTRGSWLNIPFPIITKFYFFNVTNAHDVMNKASKPILKEIGKFFKY